jgi:homogentisate 1,2-dioxygenase
VIHRHAAGLLPAKPHTVFRDPEGGALFYEEMFTRRGFADAFSYFYHRRPITPHREVSVATRALPEPVAEEGRQPLKRRLFSSDRVPAGGRLVDRRFPVLFNADLTIWLARPTESDDAYFANGDGDELWFVQEGEARLESPCGWLDVRAGDYVWVPRAMIHRWHLVSSEMRMTCFEAKGGIHVPDQFRNPVGQLMLDAPYTHRDFVLPSGPTEQDGPRDLLVKKGGRTTHYVTDAAPMDVVGWEGFVYPWAFAIEKYQPKTGLIHLPPTIHTTFAGRGFVVCSFVPRVTDTHPNAIPCPYPHSSVDCDEVILYLRGNFTSRKGVGPGAISLHPAGIAHGPHPGAYEGSIGSRSTSEMAVMVDTFLPLTPTAQGADLEEPGYHASWC